MVTSLNFRKCYDKVNPYLLADKVAKLTGNAQFAITVLQMVESRRIRCPSKTATSDTVTCDLGIKKKKKWFRKWSVRALQSTTELYGTPWKRSLRGIPVCSCFACENNVQNK